MRKVLGGLVAVSGSFLAGAPAIAGLAGSPAPIVAAGIPALVAIGAGYLIARRKRG